jgi:hypothetical protein
LNYETSGRVIYQCNSMLKCNIMRDNVHSYTLGASYCRQELVKGGMSIFVKKNSKFNHQIDIKYHCNRLDLNVVHLEFKFSNIHVLSIYRTTKDGFELCVHKRT